MDRHGAAGQGRAIRGTVPWHVKGKTMTRILTLSFLLAAAPLAALAAPAVGDMVGTNPEAATAALAEKGCKVTDFEAEDGKIEAYVVHGSTMAEVLVDPATGKVVSTKIK